jgi:hypothetical protein
MNVESPATPPPGLSHTSAIVTGPPVDRHMFKYEGMPRTHTERDLSQGPDC